MSHGPFTSLRDALAQARGADGILRDPENRDAMARALAQVGECTTAEVQSLRHEEIRQRMERALAMGRLSLVPHVRTLRPVCNVLEAADPLAADLVESNEAEVTATHTLEITLVDDEGEPVGGERYRVEQPDGEVIEGHLDANGRALLTGIEGSGNCLVSFPRWDEGAWGPA